MIRRFFPFTIAQGLNGDYDLSGEPDWLHCYSFAKRFPSATASMRVIRDSDSAELDIGFLSDGSFDIASLNSFCSGTIGRLHTYYDQFGTNDLIAVTGSGIVRPIIYDGGFKGFIDFLGLVAGLEFTTDFTTNQTFCLISSFYNRSLLINRRGDSNKGMAIATSSVNNLQFPYYGVSNYQSPTAKTSLNDNTGLKKYVGAYHILNTSLESHAYVEGIDSDTLTSMGTRALGTQLTTTQTSKIGVQLSSLGVLSSGSTSQIVDLFLFSTNQASNATIFSKKYYP